MLSRRLETLDVSEILTIAEKHILSFYDASYVWLARSRRLRLRTRDSKILSKCPDVAQRLP
jgi:predicted nucleic acid-binding protein